MGGKIITTSLLCFGSVLIGMGCGILISKRGGNK